MGTVEYEILKEKENEMKSIIIAHPGKQHSFHTAIGVKKTGFRMQYCTTVYDKPGSLTHFIKRFLSKNDSEKANTRRNSEIKDSEVCQILEWYGLYQLFMMRRNISGDRYNKINDSLNVKFGHRVAKLAKKTHVDAVISYDNNSMTLFSDLKRMSPETIRILDVSAANRIYMKEIYKSDLQLSPDFADKLKEECPIIESEKVCERVQKEIELSQYFLVGSSFVKKSLEYSGVKSEQIYICPYGVDTSKFYRKALKIRTESEPIRFVFVGGTKQLKGLSYMLQAFQKVDHTKATFTIIGADNLYEKLKEKYAKDVNFAGMILHDKMPEVLQDYDVMVFPSLGEGFSLSMVEAMACGLPVISSTNTGANDFIENSKNGFIVPIQDTDALVDKMQWFIKHHEEIPRMGKNAIKTASALTWDNYHKKVAAAIRKIVEHEKESRFAG